MFLLVEKMAVRSGVRIVGILVYALWLIIHWRFGSNANLYWWGAYLLSQNVGMALVCLGDVWNSKIAYRLIATWGFTYFCSASAFYVITMARHEMRFFSQSETAVCVLCWILIISTILTVLHYVFTPRSRNNTGVHS